MRRYARGAHTVDDLRLLCLRLKDDLVGTAKNTYGIDSMVARLRLDVSLLNSASPAMTIQKLANDVGGWG